MDAAVNAANALCSWAELLQQGQRSVLHPQAQGPPLQQQQHQGVVQCAMFKQACELYVQVGAPCKPLPQQPAQGADAPGNFLAPPAPAPSADTTMR